MTAAHFDAQLRTAASMAVRAHGPAATEDDVLGYAYDHFGLAAIPPHRLTHALHTARES